MIIKGTSIKGTYDYVKRFYPERFEEWMESLSEEHKTIYSGAIIISEWYPVEAMIEPTKKIAELFFDGDIKKCAWDLGRFGADTVLGGIYKALIQIATPGFLINRASKILTTYYKDADMEVIDYTAKFCKIRFTKLPKNESLIEYNICGWMEMALEKVGCNDIKIVQLTSLANGDLFSEYDISWI
ncbi:MAG: hypothetical protein WCT77_05655 [Bacteroidota bacterium]